MYDEVKVIKRLQRGEAQALPILMKHYQNYVYSILNTMLQTHEAQEAAQDSFIKVFRSINSFNGQSKFSTWLYAICYRTGLDYIKKRKHSMELNDQIHTLAIHSTAPETIATQELSVLLGEMIKNLKPNDAAIVRMFYFEELTLKEISSITDLSESNIKIKLFRCRKALRQSIERQSTFDYQEYLNT